MNFMRITPGRIIVALVVVSVLVSIGVTIAASRGSSSKPKRTPKNTALPTKIVPDVVGQPYVFAEGTLQAHGFGWQVEGKVAGWAEALVVAESPVANTVVVDTGAPRGTLQLAKPAGAQSGTPENSSPYSATKILFPVPAPGATTTTGTTTTGTTATTTPATTTTTPRATTTTKPTKPVSKPKPSKPAPSA